MDKLSPELLALVFSCLAGEETLLDFKYAQNRYHGRLSPYATVSRQWQGYVEEYTFRHITFCTSQLQSLRRILTRRRLGHVRCLIACFDVPNEPGCANVSSDAFARDSTLLFQLLASAPARDEPWMDIAFKLLASDPADNNTWGLTREAREVVMGMRIGSYARLPENKDCPLPEVPCVRECTIHMYSHSRFFEPRSVCVMASRMTRLQKMQMQLSDYEVRDTELRRQLRDDLASSLALIPRGIKHFTVWCMREEPIDHQYHTPSVASADGATDNLSQQLLLLSLRPEMERFAVTGTLGMDVLDYNAALHSTPTPTPSLLNMLKYELAVEAIAPTGEWIIVPRPEVVPPSTPVAVHEDWLPGYQYERRFRFRLDPTYHEQIVVAAALAAARMPRLQYLAVTLPRVGFGPAISYQRTWECLTLRKYPQERLSENAQRAWDETARVHGIMQLTVQMFDE